MGVMENLERYVEDLELFESPNEKFDYIFDIGKRHSALDEAEKNDATFIKGCASPAWLVGECKDKKLFLRGEGTSEMAKGMLVMLLDIFSGADAEEILSFDPKELSRLGILEHLSPVRQKSMEAFLEKLYTYAKECKESR